jgi:uncharacterized protein YgbK (DUF1537 family)
LVLDSGTRSLPPPHAKARINAIVAQLDKSRTEWLYKKTDSVLRGHVVLELESLLTGLNKDSALLIPANPSYGRIISEGHYFVDGVPLHETDFANDPEYPAMTSDVVGLAGKSKKFRVIFLDVMQTLPSNCVAIGEAKNRKDLQIWAAKMSQEIIPAGGAEFFKAVLDSRGLVAKDRPAKRAFGKGKTSLYVFGSSSAASYQFVSDLDKKGFRVCALPCSISQAGALNRDCLQNWTDMALHAFQERRQVGVAIHQPAVKVSGLPRKLAELTACLVKALMHNLDIDELIIEGGATASAILDKLQWQRYMPVENFAPGVVRMQVKEMPRKFVTLKPGSYRWPEQMWRDAQFK